MKKEHVAVSELLAIYQYLDDRARQEVDRHVQHCPMCATISGCCLHHPVSAWVHAWSRLSWNRSWQQAITLQYTSPVTIGESSPAVADTITSSIRRRPSSTRSNHHHVKEAELEELGTLLAVRLRLPPAEATALVNKARHAVEHWVSLYEFTQPLQATMSYEQKQDFVRMLWHVALADRRLDKYEAYLGGKVSELLYVARGEVIRLRNDVLAEKPAATGGD